MQTMRRKPNNKKRNAKKTRPRGAKDTLVALDRAGRGNMKVQIQRRNLVQPDIFTQEFIYAEPQRNIFNTAVSFGSETWAFTDLNAFRTGVSPTFIAGLCHSSGRIDNDAAWMRRYRVQWVKFIVRVQNRETINPITVILHPSQSLPAVASAAEVQWLMEQRSNCVRTLGPLNSGTSTAELRMKYNPEKFFGEEYHEQDEYSGAITRGSSASQFASPATPVYMGLSFHNVNVNTVTTGGCVLTLTVKIKVEFFQPDRDEDSSTFKGADDTLEKLEKEISELKLRAKVLARTSSH